MRLFINNTIILLALCLSVQVWAAPNIAAESYILMDAETGTVLAEHNADERLPPASLTKIMTVYLIFMALQDGRLEMSDLVYVSENAWGSKVVGSKMFIEVNTEVSVEDLLSGVIIQSGNDASIALAEALTGDEAGFSREMTETAKKIGLTNSSFKNATGLPAENHYTSAHDVAILIRRTVLDFPALYKLYAEPTFTYNNIKQPNRNRLLYSFDGADGVKTGYTEAAGYCLASSAKRDGRRLIAVVMKTASPKAREKESAKLLTYGFNQFKNIHLYKATDTRTLPIWKGAKDTITVRPQSTGVFSVAHDASIRALFAPQKPLIAPLAAGDVVGEIRLLQDGKIIQRTPVITTERVDEGGLWKVFYDSATLYWQGDDNNESAVLSEW